MASFVDPMADYPAPSVVAGAFALLVAATWFASLPGVSVALAYYGALAVSVRQYRRWRSSTTGLHRSLRFLGLVLTWLTVLAFSAVVLPSNFSTAVI
jgi:hypothetical protein